MEQILQILSSKVTMVRSDNSVNRECLWLDLPIDHRKMLYNHCASGILEASKKDPALTDLRFLQLSAGHSQTNLSGVFCLSFKNHLRATCTFPQRCEQAAIRLHCQRQFYTWCLLRLDWHAPLVESYRAGSTMLGYCCAEDGSFNHHQLLQSGFFLCWSPCLGTSSMRALKIILRQPSCYV